MTDVWEAIQEEDGPFKKTMEKATEINVTLFFKNTDEIWENRVFLEEKEGGESG